MPTLGGSSQSLEENIWIIRSTWGQVVMQHEIDSLNATGRAIAIVWFDAHESVVMPFRAVLERVFNEDI